MRNNERTAVIRTVYINVFGAKIVNVKPVKKEKDMITRIWKALTAQGMAAALKVNSPAEKKFRDSGDMSLLTYAHRRGDKFTVILTDNFNEIGQIASYLTRENKARARVLTSEKLVA